MSARDDFTQETLDVLARRVNLHCSNPGCRIGTTGPRIEPNKSVCIGVAAHITAAAVGGPRYDGSLTTEQRRSAENGIWLCQNHAKLVDNDTSRHTVEELRTWKRQAEDAARAELEGVATPRPENAAQVELTVGGVPVGGKALLRPVKKHSDDSGYCNRHDYELVVTVRNLGNERLSDYHVDLEFPTRALERPEAHPAYVRSRSTRKHAFFRASGERAPELFPGAPCQRPAGIDPLRPRRIDPPRRARRVNSHAGFSSFDSERFDWAGPRSPGPRVTKTSAC